MTDRNEPLELLAIIERRPDKKFPVLMKVSSENAVVSQRELARLHTALEAQAEELAQAHARIARLEDALSAVYADAANVDDPGYTPAKDWDKRWPEWAKRDLEPWQIARDVLAEHPRQSAAAIKAEAWGWKRLDQEPPPERDRWYLFGGWTDSGKWVFEKMHYSLSGLVNGWRVETAIHNGNTHWCDVVPPADRIELDAKEKS